MMPALLLGCFAIGALARRVKAVPRDAPRVLNLWVLWVSLPALVLLQLHRVTLAPRFFLAAVVLQALFAACAGLAVLAVRRGLLERKVAGALALSAGLGNTAFIGVPLAESLGGPEAVGPAALIDQLGSFLTFSLGAVPFAMAFGGLKATPRVVLARLFTFPPFLALLLALVTRPLPFPPELEALLKRFADLLTPLALASVGWHLTAEGVAGSVKPVAAGLAWKLGLAPAVMLGVLALAGGPFTVVDLVAVAQAAMAPMVTAAVLASEYGLAASVSATMAAVGAVVSFVTVPAWWSLAERLLR